MCSVIKFYIASCYSILKVIIIFYLVPQYTYVTDPNITFDCGLLKRQTPQLVELHNIT